MRGREDAAQGSLSRQHICTAEDPWTPEKSKRAMHPDAVGLEDQDGYACYKCPHCGKYFEVELPQ